MMRLAVERYTPTQDEKSSVRYPTRNPAGNDEVETASPTVKSMIGKGICRYRRRLYRSCRYRSSSREEILYNLTLAQTNKAE